MTAMPPLRDILNNTPADAINVDFNFNTIEGHVANEVINRDGSVAMTGPLSLSGLPAAPQHAVTKQYVDTVAIPVGVIWQFAGDVLKVPAGWALCDGAVKSQTQPDYAALFAVIGTLYNTSGGQADPGAGSFRLPNLKGRLPVGLDAAVPVHNTLGDAGGSRDAIVPTHNHSTGHSLGTGTVSADHTHSTPNHQHTFTTGTDSPDHTHEQAVITMVDNAEGTSDYPTARDPIFYAFSANAHKQTNGASARHAHPGTTDANQGGGTTGGISTNHTHGVTGAVTVNDAGVSGVNQNLPPYVTVNFIIRIG